MPTPRTTVRWIALTVALTIGIAACDQTTSPTAAAVNGGRSPLAHALSLVTASFTGVQSGRCMQPMASAAFSRLEIETCTGATNQEFTFDGTTLGMGGFCVGDSASLGTNGGGIELLTCDGSSGQQWTYSATAKTFVGINSKCIDVAGQYTGNGGLLQLYSCNGQTNQEWDSSVVAGSTHEPSGMTTVLNTGTISTAPSQTQNGSWTVGTATFTMFSPATWSSPFEDGQAANLTLVPSGTGYRITYPTLLPGGGYSPVRFGAPYASDGTGTLYMRWLMRVSTNWTDNGNVATKLFFQRTAVDSQTNHFIGMWGTASNLWLEEGLQFPGGSGNVDIPNLTGAQTDSTVEPNALITGGAWHTVELLMVQEATPGQSTGTYSLWVDGNAAYSTTGLHYLKTGDTAGWSYIMFDPTYGGGSNSPPSSMYWDFDQLYVSVK